MNYPVCNDRHFEKCFAERDDETCNCLEDTSFKGSCPFYKTVRQRAADKARAKMKGVKNGTTTKSE